MRKLRMVIFGYGQRGTIYGSFAKAYPNKYKVVAIIENNSKRMECAKNDFNDVSFFEDYHDFLNKKIMADFVAISTQDESHHEHAIAMMENGYDLLLEKPIAPSRKECEDIYNTSIKYNRKVIVCHVLRYSPFYSAIKKEIDKGTIGDIIDIIASENIGYYHYAHSYVRGPWRKESEGSPLILAKCCHDMDIIRYLIGKKCLSVSSVGGLSYFNKENAPKGSANYCSDCKLNECPFNAQKIYLSKDGDFFSNYFTTKKHTRENVLKDLEKSQYDRCVFKSDNDVADHQATMMKFEGGIIANHMASAFSKEIYRDIKVHGTKGEIFGKMEDNRFEIRLFDGRIIKKEINISNITVGKHNGSDYFMLNELYKEFNGKKGNGITYLDVSVESHYMCFAAETSRKEGGKLVNL